MRPTGRKKSRGAWLHDARLPRVGSRAAGRCAGGDGDSLLRSWRLCRMEPNLRRDRPRSRRGFAASARPSLDLAYVAQGRFDGFWESGLNEWDTAAGCLLVREAGGFVTDYRGRSTSIHADQVLAANDVLHSKLHKLLAGSLR